jgi:purine-binding chemotaxis protein CheW
MNAYPLADLATHDQSQHLTFFIADEEFAVKILKAREILEYGAVTKVPGAPPAVRGVINLRGSVVPVVDLALKFGLPESPVTKQTCIVIVEVESGENKTTMGVIVDSISQVVDLPPEQIEPAPDFGTMVKLEYLLGMGRSGQKFVMILDIDKALSPAELSSVAAIFGQAPSTEEAPEAPGTDRGE